MQTADKIRLCSGADFWTTEDFTAEGIPPFMVSDGPNGLRKQTVKGDHLGINNAYPATAFPTASLTACSFDEELLETVGRTIAREALAQDVKVVLGPGANIKRNPLCGRNFEYFSEDPLLSGKMAAAFIRGAQSEGGNACVKHFALNNQEYKRFSSNSMADARTMREIYLRPFELAVTEGRPACVMSSYNLMNGVHSSQNKWLLTDVLRREWGFKGLVMTDWGGMSDRTAAFEAGCDLCMPGGSRFGESKALADVQSGRLSERFIDASVDRIRALAVKPMPKVTADLDTDYHVAREAAEGSMVLLKNEGGLLPLRDGQEVAFIGHMAESMRYQGAGSSHINPHKLVSPLEALEARAGGAPLLYAPGCNADGSTDEALLARARALAACTDTVVLFIGLTDKYESEGFDRDHMHLPEGHLRLAEAVCDACENVIVVLMSGSAVELPFLPRVKALVYAGLPGEAGGEAMVNLLYGRVNPSGKLAETWAASYDDYVTAPFWGERDPLYREGIYVGYRYFQKAGAPVNFCFGHGLSYTAFAYSDAVVEEGAISCTVRNVGPVAGKEAVQLYVENPGGYRAKRELRAFRKVSLAPGEATRVTFPLTDDMFSVWDEGWRVVGGTYKLQLASSSEDIRLEVTYEVAGAPLFADPDLAPWYTDPAGTPTDEDFATLYRKPIQRSVPTPGNFTMENTIMEMKDHSWVMRAMYKVLELFMARSNGGKVDYEDPTFRMMMVSSADSSLSNVKICGGMDNMVFEGLLEMANGHFWRGLATMLKKN